MSYSHPNNSSPAAHPLRDGRLVGLGLALAQFEVPASDGVFDDLLRQLAAIEVPAVVSARAAASRDIRSTLRGARLLPRRRTMPWRAPRVAGAV